MKKIGFLSFGHWTPSPQSQTRSASDALLQSIDLAVAAEELGADGAYFRVHHFARQLGSPFPLLAAVGAKTRRIEIGTAVIDMRYENCDRGRSTRQGSRQASDRELSCRGERTREIQRNVVVGATQSDQEVHQRGSG